MKKILIAFVFCTFFISCKKELDDPGGTATQKMAGEWWVQLYNPNGSLAYPASYRGHLYTYNTSANTNEIWIDDYSDPQGNLLWDFKVKVPVDLSTLTFSASKVTSVVPGYGIKVSISEGKVLQEAAKTKSGNAADSIYMKVEFSDDPGTIYSIRGHRRTGFFEDEY
jgi:hypothetical protein